VLQNRINDHRAIVGNVCVKRFLGLPSEAIFAGLRRIARDPERALTAEAVEYAHSQRWINDWEKDFSHNTRRKGRLSERQLAKRLEINNRILDRATRRRPVLFSGEGRRDG
jgi:hypothetical protein